MSKNLAIVLLVEDELFLSNGLIVVYALVDFVGFGLSAPHSGSFKTMKNFRFSWKTQDFLVDF